MVMQRLLRVGEKNFEQQKHVYTWIYKIAMLLYCYVFYVCD